MDRQLRDRAVNRADQPLEAAAFRRLGQLLLAQPCVAFGPREVGEDTGAGLCGGLAETAARRGDLRVGLAGGGEGGVAVARRGDALTAHLYHAQLRDIALLQQLLVGGDLLVEQGEGFVELVRLNLRLGPARVRGPGVGGARLAARPDLGELGAGERDLGVGDLGGGSGGRREAQAPAVERGEDGAKPRGVEFGGLERLAGLRRVGIGDGGIEFDQRLARADRLPVADQYRVDDPRRAGLDQLDVVGGNQLARRRGDDVDPAQHEPQQRGGQQAEQEPGGDPRGRRHRALDHLQRGGKEVGLFGAQNRARAHAFIVERVADGGPVAGDRVHAAAPAWTPIWR